MTTILATLLCAVALQEPAAKTLDYETHAISLRQAFKAIGDQAGMKLVVSDDLAAEPIILRLKGVPVQEALDKIATVVGGEWRKRDDGSLLFLRTDAMAERFEEEARKRRAAAFRKGIGEFTTRFAKFKPMDLAHAREVTSEISRLTAEQRSSRSVRTRRFERYIESPNFRLFARTISLLDADELSAIRSGERVVYSSRANAMQRQLEGPWEEVLEAYQTEQANYAQAAAEVATQGDYFLIPSNIGLPLEDSSKVVIVLQNEPQAGWTNAQMFLIAGDRLLAQASSFLDFSRTELTALSQAVNRTISEARADEEITTSQAVRDMRARMDRRAKPGQAVSDDALARLTHPERWDPLANATSDILIAIAKKRSENLVAYVGDNFESFALQQGDGLAVRTRAFLAEAKFMRDHEIASEDGWLVARCVNPNDAMRIRAPRPTLGEFVRNVYKDGRLTLESTSSLVTDVKNDLAIEYAKDHGWLIHGQESFLLSRGYDLLRLYATLSGQDRAAMRSESVSVNYGSLNERQRELVSSLWYGPQAQIQREGGVLAGPDGDTPPIEPTEVLPQGMPKSASITFRLLTEPTVFVDETDTSGTSEITPTVSGFASLMAQREFPKRYPWIAQYQWGLAGLGSMRTFSVNLAPSSLHYVGFAKMEPKRPATPKVSIADLLASMPPDMKAEYERTFRERREEFAKLPATQPEIGDPIRVPPP